MRHSQFLDIICNTADGVFVVDGRQQIIRWNKGAEEILKRTEADVLNLHCYDVIAGRTKGDKPWCHENCKVHGCVRAGRQIENFDLLTRTKDGAPLWTNVSIVSTTDELEPLTVHLIRDVTSERRIGDAIDQFLFSLDMPGAVKPQHERGIHKTGPVRPALSHVPSSLSGREIEVLRLLADGLSTKAIAEKLKISRFTARNHIQNVLAKLGLHNKAQAVSYAFKQGLL